MTIKETPNRITAVLKVTVTAEFFDDEASEETLRYCVEQDLEDAGFDVDVSLLKEQEPAWISVKDKLPKSMANKVIVYLEHEDYVGYIGLGHYEKFRGEELWYDLENNEQFSKRGYTVTHWMPLPEPPTEGR